MQGDAINEQAFKIRSPVQTSVFNETEKIHQALLDYW